MATLHLRLLGPGTLSLDDAPVRPHSAKALALLAFLVLEPGRPHGREKLAALLWGGQPERSARQGLRQALHSLRSLARGALDDRLVADRDSVAFAPGPGIDVDALHFLEDVRSTDPERWRAAAERYRAPLLDGRTIGDADEFEQWLAGTRDRLHALALQNLDRLAAHHASRAELDAALACAHALRDLDPESEAARRHLARIRVARDRGNLPTGEPPTRDGSRPDALANAAHENAARENLASTSDDPPRASRSPPTPAVPPAPVDAEPYVRAALAAERVHAFSQAADLYDRALRVLERCVPAAPERRCEVLLHKESMLERLGRRAEQVETIERALSIATQLHDGTRLASVLLRKAGACAYLGHHADALRAAERALAICRDVGDAPGEAEALRELGFVHWQANDAASALTHAREALALHRRLGDVTGEASALHNLAEIHRALGSPRQALDLYEQALRLHWSVGNHEGEILTLFGVANTLWQAGDVEGAMGRYGDALALSERHGERTMQTRTLHALATRHAVQGDLDDALRLMQRAIDVDRAIGYAHGLGHDLVELARIHAERGERAQAQAALTEATVWFGFTENQDALRATRAWIDAGASGMPPIAPASAAWPGVKSHVTLGEGKVYCAFESPGACGAPRQTAP